MSQVGTYAAQGHLSPKQRPGSGLVLALHMASHGQCRLLQGCVGMGFEGKTQALLKSRGLLLLVVRMVYCYAHGEFKTLGEEFLSSHLSHMAYLAGVAGRRKGRD